MPGNIAVIGPGAIGTLLAARLHEAGFDVVLFDHDPARAARISSSGISLTDLDGIRTVSMVRVTSDPAEIGSCPTAFFCVKAYSTAAAAECYARFASDNLAVVTFQNGMGNAEILAAAFGGANIVAATTSEGARVDGWGVTVHTGYGPTHVGAFSPQAEGVAQGVAAMLASAGFSAACIEDIAAALWRKLAVNAVINPLTALLGVSNGELFRARHTAAIATDVITETVRAATGTGLDEALFVDLHKYVRNVAAATAANVSSMLQDINNRRPTEIDAICGHVVSTAASQGWTASANLMLLRMIKIREFFSGVLSV